MLVDTHCHLDVAYFPDGPDEALARARENGVGFFVVIGVARDGLGAAHAAVELSKRRDDVRAVAGIHPHDASILTDAMAEELERIGADPNVVAIGEIGLDFHYTRSPREVQERVFRRLVGVAKRVKKPVVVHTREAPAETLAILDEEGARDVGGIIHCFSEDRAFAGRALDLGFDLSFSGIVTFKNATAIQDVAAWAPIDRILVETDSPYLAPVPHRGKKCEPAHVVMTAKRVAELRGTTLDEIAARTTENAKRRLALPI